MTQQVFSERVKQFINDFPANVQKLLTFDSCKCFTKTSAYNSPINAQPDLSLVFNTILSVSVNRLCLTILSTDL